MPTTRPSPLQALHRFVTVAVAFGLLLAPALVAPVLAAADTGVADVPLRGEWRPAGAPQAGWHAFDPQRLTRIPRQPDGADVRLWLDASAPDGPLVLAVRKPALERIRWAPPGGGDPLTADLLQVARQGWMGHGRIGFALPTSPAPDEPLLLRIEPQAGINGTLAFAVQPLEQFLAEDARWLALVSTCLALLAGMAVMALVFSLRLRDPAFVYYAVYLVSYGLIQGIQTGYVANPLGWSAIADAPRLWGRHAVVVSVVMVVLFLVRFAGLRIYLPRAVRPLLFYAGAVAMGAALNLLPFAPAQALSRILINPLLILGGPLLLVVAVLAWRNGSRYAGFFVVGWTPLLLATVLGSLQLFGLFDGWTWSDEGALVAAAFEALVLSAGLADRAAAVRRDRDAARALADIDPLTDLPNRRALRKRLDALASQAPVAGAPLAVLFCDLDRFKQLNDTLGHATGDEALRAVAAELRQELRARDSIGRYGGEEFVLLLPGCGAAEACTVAERLRVRVMDVGMPPRFGDTPLTVSIGVAVQAPGEAVDAVLARADGALYAAKGAGRNRVVLADALPRPQKLTIASNESE